MLPTTWSPEVCTLEDLTSMKVTNTALVSLADDELVINLEHWFGTLNLIIMMKEAISCGV